jgi:hypothetical protein
MKRWFSQKFQYRRKHQNGVNMEPTRLLWPINPWKQISPLHPPYRMFHVTFFEVFFLGVIFHSTTFSRHESQVVELVFHHSDDKIKQFDSFLN